MSILNYILPHPVTVTIYEQRSDGIKPVRDKARFIEERKGKRYFHFRKKGITKPIPLTSIDRKNHAEVYMTDRGVMLPVRTEFKLNKNETLDVSKLGIDEDVKFWVSQEFREADFKYEVEPGFWEKYKDILQPIMIFVGAGIFFWILTNRLDEVLSNNLGQLIKATNTIAKATESVSGAGW